MKLKVKNEHEKALAESLQKNLAKYNKLSTEEKLFLEQRVEYCQYLQIDGRWEQATLLTWDCRCRLNPNIEIIVEKEQTFAEREGIILCEIKKTNSTTGWVIEYPNGTAYGSQSLGALRCEGYEFLGWVHNDVCNDYNDIHTNDFMYRDSYRYIKVLSGIGYIPSTAKHSAWRKVSE